MVAVVAFVDPNVKRSLCGSDVVLTAPMAPEDSTEVGTVSELLKLLPAGSAMGNVSELLKLVLDGSEIAGLLPNEKLSASPLVAVLLLLISEAPVLVAVVRLGNLSALFEPKVKGKVDVFDGVVVASLEIFDEGKIFEAEDTPKLKVVALGLTGWEAVKLNPPDVDVLEIGASETFSAIAKPRLPSPPAALVRVWAGKVLVALPGVDVSVV